MRLNTARGEATPNDVAARQILMQAARSMSGEPADARVLLAAGELQLGRGEAAEAQRYLEKAAALAPRNADVQQNLGRAFALLGNDVGARASFERAAELEPDPSRALEELAQLDAHEPARQAAVLLRAGERAARAYDDRRAERAFAKALQLDPKNAPAVRDREAALYARFGDAERARSTWQQAIDAGGVSPARVLGVAQASRALGDTSGAEAGFRKALELDPRSGAAALALGGIYTEMGRLDEARPWLERAVALSPRDPAPQLRAGGRAAPGRPVGRGARAAPRCGSGGRSDAAQGCARARPSCARAATRPVPWRACSTRSSSTPSTRACAGSSRRCTSCSATPPPPASSETTRRCSRAPRHRARARRPRAPATAGTDEGGDALPVDERLAELVHSFGAVESDTGRVALVGVRERNDFVRRTRPRVCARRSRASGRTFRIAPRSIARSARRSAASTRSFPRKEIDEALSNLANRVPRGGAARVRAPGLARRRTRSSELNLALDSDALFLARVERVPDERSDPGSRCSGATPVAARAAPALRPLAGLDAHPRQRPVHRVARRVRALEPRDARAARRDRARVRVPGRARLGRRHGHGQPAAGHARAVQHQPVAPRAEAAGREEPEEQGAAKSLIEDGLRRLNRYERVLREGEPRGVHLDPRALAPFYVTVRGPLINSTTGELIGDFLEEQLVRVRRGKAVAVKFDLRPKETVLEITVIGADKSSRRGRARAEGVPSSLRYANDGGVFLYLQPGKHTLLVGAGDRCWRRCSRSAPTTR